MQQTITIKKGYKQTDLGVITEDWEVKTINEAKGLSSSNLKYMRFFAQE